MGALHAFESVWCAHVVIAWIVQDVLVGEWFDSLGKRRVLLGAHHKGDKGGAVELFACALPHSNTSGMSEARLDDV